MTGPEEALTPKDEPVDVLAQAPQLGLPQVDWRAIAPELALLVTGVVVLLWVAFVPGTAPATPPAARST